MKLPQRLHELWNKLTDEPKLPVIHPCLHGNERVDCEEKCAGCGHDCGAHTSAICHAAWSETLHNPIEGFGPQYVQKWCNCDRFKP